MARLIWKGGWAIPRNRAALADMMDLSDDGVVGEVFWIYSTSAEVFAITPKPTTCKIQKQPPNSLIMVQEF